MDSGTESGEDARPGPGSLSFSTILAYSSRLYRAHLRTLFGLFALIALVMTAVPSLFVFDFAENVALPLYLLLAVVLPAVLASIGFGLTASLLWNRQRTGLAAEMHPVTLRGVIDELGRHRNELLASALLSGMIALAVALFLGGLGLLLLGLFFGPPILVQVITVERKSMQEAWGRTRQLLRRKLARVLLYLLTVSLGIGLLSAVTLNAVFRMTEGMLEAARYVLLGGSQVLIVGLTTPLLACASFACYDVLRSEAEWEAQHGDEPPGSDEPPLDDGA